MSKGLEALENLYRAVEEEYSGTSFLDEYKQNKEAIEKELKALDLLLNKVLDKDGLNILVDMFYEKSLITKENYELLKEVLL